MALKDLKIAYVEPINGSRKNERIEVLFNPAEYSIEKGNTFQSTSLPGLSSPVSQFVTGNADTLTMELFFDTYTRSLLRHPAVGLREDVRKYTRKLTSLLDIDPELHAPPVVQFVWGPPIGSPEGLQFTSIIEKISQKFTLFLDDGTPVRATVNVTFKEYKTIEQQLQEIKRQSPDRTKRVVFAEGDSLWMYAFEEYNNPALWRVIAAHNGIDNPRLIDPGTELEVPPLP